MIPFLRERFPAAVVGYSGHEKSGALVYLAASVLGAKLIERHFTLDRTMRGPDHAASLEPNGLSSLVQQIRKAERAMGTGEKTIAEGELAVRRKLGKSVVARRAIPRGTVVTLDMLTMKSPGAGLTAKALDRICGRIAMVDVPADTLVPVDAVDWPEPKRA
jgi:sialic acid synthase SpsE